MNAEELAEAIEDLLRAVVEDEEGDETELLGARLTSLRRAGSLTPDAGFVVTLGDGAEFEITVTPLLGTHDNGDQDAAADDGDEDAS